jgi:hypothetical protein
MTTTGIPETDITLTLKAKEWNNITYLLARVGPYLSREEKLMYATACIRFCDVWEQAFQAFEGAAPPLHAEAELRVLGLDLPIKDVSFV